MHCVDVNVLLYAVNATSEHHQAARATLTALVTGPDPVVILPVVALGFLRLATDRRVLTRPLTPAEASGYLDTLTSHPHVSIAEPGPGQWHIFRELHDLHGPAGPDVTDVFLAACAMDLDATWVSFDRGFARFAGLVWLLPTVGSGEG